MSNLGAWNVGVVSLMLKSPHRSLDVNCVGSIARSSCLAEERAVSTRVCNSVSSVYLSRMLWPRICCVGYLFVGRVVEGLVPSLLLVAVGY